MNHPSSEDWMSFLYGEAPRSEHGALQAHLHACPDCRRRVADWSESKTYLGRWQLAPQESRWSQWATSHLAKWAMAALLVLGLGYGIGRFSGPRVDMAALRAALEPTLRESLVGQIRQQVQDEFQADWDAALAGSPELINTDFRRQLRGNLEQWTAKTVGATAAENQRLLADLLDTYRANRLQDQRATVALYNQAEQKRRADYVNLRTALETVALVAADRFQRAESELGQLATYAQSNFEAEPTGESTNPLTPKGN